MRLEDRGHFLNVGPVFQAEEGEGVVARMKAKHDPFERSFWAKKLVSEAIHFPP